MPTTTALKYYCKNLQHCYTLPVI